MTQIIPVPRSPISVRAATPSDLAFIDQLQRVHTHMVGWMPGKQLEGKIALGQVLIAEQIGTADDADDADLKTANTNSSAQSAQSAVTPLGYCIAHDQYAGRDDVGIVYQLNVLPLKQRNLIGATLIKSVFERAAYGCKLFCCWCAQDIQANWFWESCGFVPLAFRTGSASKQRIHIFWQRRVRADDETTPYWFPSLTKAGAVREDRLVLPIPPGTHWRDCKPVILPGITVEPELPKTLPGGAPIRIRPEQPQYSAAQKAVLRRAQSKHLKGVPLGKKAVITRSGIKYVDRTDFVPELDAPDVLAEPPKPKRAPKPRQINDPKHVAAARELRDRYLEHVNGEQANERWLIAPGGKYDVSRVLPAPTQNEKDEARMIAA